MPSDDVRLVRDRETALLWLHSVIVSRAGGLRYST